MNNDYMDSLYFLIYRSLSQASRRSTDDYNNTIYSNEDIIEKVPYYINSHGYRSKEFDKNDEILVLGCSQTYGSGMFDEFTWPSIFSSSIEKKYSRLATLGDSIGAQVYKAFKYFEEIGNPEIVVGLFPLHRLEYVSVPGKFIANLRSGNTELERLCVGIAYLYEEKQIEFSKIPHDPEHVIPREMSIFYNFMFIKMLEQYCESHNIKFIWSIYDDKNIATVIQSSAGISKNYLNTSDQHFCKNENKFCGTEFNKHRLYNWAADYNSKKHLGHWGIHMHRHMAENFIGRYMEIKND